MKNNRKRNAGFTLIELLVVMAILALLAGLVGPKVLGEFDKAKSKSTAVQIADIDKAMEIFKLDVGRYPTNEEGLAALVKRPGALNGWAGPYLKSSDVPADAWGRPFHYANPGPNGGIEILSLGADNAPGGDGDNADVRNKN